MLNNKKMPKLCLALCGLSVGLMSGTAAADLLIPTVPLQTGSDVPANLMFILDDSGSMDFGYLPDSLPDCSSSTSSNNIAYLKGRSPQFNKQYYNPDVTYAPPPGFANMSFTSARPNGYIAANSSSNANRSLATDFRPIWDGRSTIVYCGAKSAADYYTLNAGCSESTTSTSCFTRVNVANGTAAEKTNFANWYSYYSTRLQSSKAGIAHAFYTLPETIRVGYGALNISPKIAKGVREFSGTNRSDFFSWLSNKVADGGTNLREALRDAGEYFSKDEPYYVDPTKSSSGIVSCRQNFTVMMSDGGWQSDTVNLSDLDGDGYANTLADVAYKYWSTDLRTGNSYPNNVPTSTLNNANWQHMVTYGVNLGVNGLLDPNVAKDWAPNDSRWGGYGTLSDQSSPKRIDDLLHAAVNSKGGFFSSNDPVKFNEELTSTLRNIINRIASASNLTATTTSLQEDNSVFQASFNTSNWSGTLIARDVDTLTEQWSANFPSHDTRKIYTANAGALVEFKWANLSTAQRTALQNQNLVNYLRGDKTHENSSTNTSGQYRERVSLLGDIAHSTPAYVAAPQNRNYQRYSWAGASSYAAYLTDKKGRSPVVYVGANDGMLHAFNANAASADKGKEVFAYVPQEFTLAGTLLPSFASKDYEHKFFMDGTPSIGDVFINNAWRTVLVSSVGRGGSSVFALDITDPSNITLLWDKKLPEVGFMTAKPVIARLANNRWGAIMPYGYNNGADKNGILVFDIENGATTEPIKVEAPASADYLGQIEGWDGDGDGNAELFFAGDLKGNVWKFDFSSSSSSSWGVAGGSAPLFIAKNKAGVAQPITGGLTLTSHPVTGQLWIYFGTGKFLETGDSLNNAQQSWYGITDGGVISSRSQLFERTMTNVTYTNPESSAVRTARQIPQAGANDLNGKRGWVMDLIDARERITSKPRLVGGNLVMNTIIPDSDLCNPEGDGWVMALDPFTGGRLNYNFFDLSRDNKFDEKDALANNIAASGVKFEGMPGEPVFVGDEMLIGDSRVAIDKGRVNLQLILGRVSWREVTN